MSDTALSPACIVTATKLKLRFFHNGQVSVEDLWDIPLKDLDRLAVATDTSLAVASKSFLSSGASAATPAQKEAALKLEVLQFVIREKEADNAAKAEAAQKRAQRKFLQQLLAKRQTDDLESLSREEIEKQLAELGPEV